MEQIYVLHTAGIVQFFRILVICRQKRLRGKGFCGRFQQPFSFLYSEKIGISDETFFHRHAAPYQETAAPHFRKTGGQSGQAPAQRRRNLLIEVQCVGFAVDTVPAEELICTFPGDHHLYLPGGFPGDEVEGHRRRVSGGLVHMI